MWKKYRYRVVEIHYDYFIQRRWLFKWEFCVTSEVADGRIVKRYPRYRTLEEAKDQIRFLLRKPAPIQVVYVHK